MSAPANTFRTVPEFKGVQGHELLHMMETIRARMGRFLLATTGLARYSLSNEGTAVVPEQLCYPTFDAYTKERRWHMILARHLAVSLGTGFDKRIQPMSSSELYAILNDVFLVYESQREDTASLETAETAAHSQAWQLVSYAKAGTDGGSESGITSWILPYAPGNMKAWIAEEHRPGAYYQDSVGKYNRFELNQRKTMIAVGALAI